MILDNGESIDGTPRGYRRCCERAHEPRVAYWYADAGVVGCSGSRFSSLEKCQEHAQLQRRIGYRAGYAQALRDFSALNGCWGGNGLWPLALAAFLRPTGGAQ